MSGSPDRRRAQALAELLVALACGTLVLGLSAQMFVQARRADLRTCQGADVAHEAALAHSSLSRDLASLQYHPQRFPLTIADGPGAPSGRLAFHVAARQSGAPAQSIEYEFDPGAAVLSRWESGGPPRRFRLGMGSAVHFAFQNPSYGDGSRPVIGAYHNGLSYRITACSTSVSVGTRRLTLVGTVPLGVKASWDTFAFWNLPAYAWIGDLRPRDGAAGPALAD